MTVWVVIWEALPHEAGFFGLMRLRFERGARGYLFGAQGTSMSDPALLRTCARFGSRAEAEAALGASRDDDYLYHFVELTEEQVALLDLGDVE